jgi:hypothetical protein
MEPGNPKDRSGRWLGVLLVLWVLSFLVARALLDREFLERTEMATWLRVLVAVIPIPVGAALLITVIRAIRGMDELKIRIQLEALAVAYPLAVLLLMTLGLLELAVPLSPADWSYRHVWPFLILFYVGGVALANRRYQ